MIHKTTSRNVLQCEYCDWQLPAGEVHWRDADTGCVGCSHRCCRDAIRLARQVARQRLSVHGMGHLFASVGE